MCRPQPFAVTARCFSSHVEGMAASRLNPQKEQRVELACGRQPWPSTGPSNWLQETLHWWALPRGPLALSALKGPHASEEWLLEYPRTSHLIANRKASTWLPVPDDPRFPGKFVENHSGSTLRGHHWYTWSFWINDKMVPLPGWSSPK